MTGESGTGCELIGSIYAPEQDSACSAPAPEQASADERHRDQPDLSGCKASTLDRSAGSTK